VKDITDLRNLNKEEILDWGGFLKPGNRINEVISSL